MKEKRKRTPDRAGAATTAAVKALVEEELNELDDARVISHIRKLLVEPTAVLRAWDYGAPNEAYPCWRVLNHPNSNTGIAYCEFGFGPKAPWGLVALSGTCMSIGDDAAWFTTFRDAFFDSMAACDLPIWRVFKQEIDSCSYPGVALTAESGWHETWKEIYSRRTADSNSRYNCHHSIRIKGRGDAKSDTAI